MHTTAGRAFVSGLAALAGALAVSSGAALAQLKPHTTDITQIEIKAVPLSSFERSGETKSYGALEWRGGVVLTSTNASFGGWSGLWIEPDGKSLLAVSDAGSWMQADITYQGRKPTGLKNAIIGPLRTKSAALLANNRDRDAEGLTLIEGNLTSGTALISFERNDRIGRFPIENGKLGAPAGYLPLPPEAKRLKNEGFEALTVLRGGPYAGSIIAIAENPLQGQTEHTGWIWVEGQPKAFTLKGLGDYGATDAASLSDGTLLVLERYFSWLGGVKMRIIRIAPDAVRPGGVVEGELLIDSTMAQEIDNMEGLAVVEKDGEAVLTLISDDNFNHAIQRTVLLQFALPLKKTAATP